MKHTETIFRRRPVRIWGRLAAGLLVLPVLLVGTLLGGVRFAVSDATRARGVVRLLDGAIPGRLELDALHWELPAQLVLQGVQVFDANQAVDAPVIVAQTVAARMHLRGLLHHRIDLTDVRVENANVSMHRGAGAENFDLVNAFVPPASPHAPPEVSDGRPWMVSLDNITLQHVNFALQDSDMLLTVQDALAREGAFWVEGDGIGVGAKLHATVALTIGDTRLRLPDLDVVVDQGVWRVVGDNAEVGVRRLQVTAAENKVDAVGHLQLAGANVTGADLTADIRIDTASAMVRDALPPAVRKQVQGRARVQAKLQGDTQAWEFALNVEPLPDTPAPRLARLPLDALHLTGKYAAPTLTIEKLALQSGDTRLQVDGHVALSPDHPSRLGAHVLHVQARELPLARALAPFVSGHDLLPGRVDLQMDAAGDALWPPRNKASLLMSVRDIPKKLIGVPDPLHIDGALEGQGNKIHIKHFLLRGEDTDFALEGDMPLHPDGVMDVISELKQMKSGKTLRKFKVPLGVREVRLRTRVTGTLADPHVEGTLWADDITASDRVMQLRAPFGFARQTLRLHGAELTLQDGRAEVSGTVSLAAPANLDMHATLQNVPAAASGVALSGNIDADIKATGALDAPVADARVVWHAAGRPDSAARAEVSLVAQSDARGMHVQKLSIVPTDGGTSTLSGAVQWDTRRLDLDWEARGISAGWLAQLGGAGTDLGANGTLRANGHVEGPWATPRGKADITLEKVGITGVALGDVNVVLQGDARELVSTVTVAPKRSRLKLTTTVYLPEAEHPLRVAGNVEVAPLWASDVLPDVTAEATDAEIAASGRWSWNARAGLHAAVEISQLDAHIGKKTVSLERPTHLRWSRDEGGVDDMHLRGELAALWVRGHWGQRLSAQADGHIDLRVLSDFVPALGSADGTMELALRVDGTPQHPDAHGHLRITSPVILRLRQVAGEIYVDRGAVNLAPSGLTLSDWRGRYGFGTLELDGRVGLAGLAPDAYDVRLRVTDAPWRTPELLLELSADLRVTGKSAAPHIAGKLDVTRGRFIKRFDLHDFYVQAKPSAASVALKDKAPGLEKVALDIHVGTSNELSVNVDAGIFAVKTDLQADLHVTGNVVYPKINGSLRAEGGTLKFPDAGLSLTEANLDFTPGVGTGHGIDAKVHLLGEGTVTSTGANSQTYAVTLKLDGDLEKMLLDLQATPDLTRLEVLSLLTTGHSDLSELVQQSSDSDSKLNAAMVFAGSQLSEPVTRYASAQIERYAKLKVDLAAQVTQDSVTLTASKQVMSRLRLQGAYQHGIGNDTAAVTAGAQVALTDRLFFEGTQVLPTASSGTVDNYAQGSLQLKWRLLGH